MTKVLNYGYFGNLNFKRMYKIIVFANQYVTWNIENHVVNHSVKENVYWTHFLFNIRVKISTEFHTKSFFNNKVIRNIQI